MLTGSDIFKNRETSVSSKLKWTPSIDTDVTLRAFYDDTNSDQGAGYGVFPGSVGVDGTRYIGKYEIANRRDPEMFSEQYNVGLKVSQNLGFATLLSLTGFNHTDNTVRASQNGIPGLPVTGQSGIEFNNIGTSRTFTQEVQLLSRGDGSLRWILGAFYLHDRLDLIVETLPTCVGNICARAPTASRIFGGQDLKSYAAFGEVTIALDRATRLTLGARYTSDHRDISDGYREPIRGLPVSVPSLPAPIRPGDPFPGFPNGIDPTVTFDKVTWRGVVAHDFTPRVMAYASVNRGFKAGALSPVTASNPAARPEVLDAYEVGVKSQLFDRRLRANLSAYHYDYKDVQLRTLGPPAPPGTSIIYNAAAARVRGVDAEFVLTASRHLRLNASFSIVDAEFTSFPAGICSITRPINPATTPAVLGGTTSAACDLSGFRMPRAPKFTGIAGFSYRVPTRMGAFGLVVNDAYNSGFFWEPDNRLRQRSYHQLSGSITWTTPDERFDVQLYGRNVNNPYYFNAAAEGAGGNDTYNPGDRATYGVRLGVRL